MRDRTFEAILCLSLLLVACSTTSRPEPVQPEAIPTHDALTAEYRAELERAAERVGSPVPETRPFELEMNVPRHESVEAAVRYFSGDRRQTIQNSFSRSAPWVPMIHQILSSYGLPPDLAYLPVIESGYRTILTSSAGAHGMWQFMPPTAREYGLRVDWWVDERADPWKATRAAAHYLSDLHRMFGDWSLALAAYNCGPGRVRRTLTEQKATTFWELLEKRALPKETRGYVPTFYATIVLAGQPDRYGFRLPPSTTVAYEEVEVRGPVSLKFLADATSIGEDAIRGLNAALHRGVVPPGSWKLRVPSGSAAKLASRDWYLEDSTVQIASYSFRAPDTIESFARRVGVDSSDLRSMNALRSNSIPAGTTLWIPLRQTDLSARLTTPESGGGWHTVSAGDTLYSIARRHGLSVEELVDLNRLGSDHVIHPGDRLTVRSSAIGTGGM